MALRQHLKTWVSQRVYGYTVVGPKHRPRDDVQSLLSTTNQEGPANRAFDSTLVGQELAHDLSLPRTSTGRLLMQEGLCLCRSCQLVQHVPHHRLLPRQGRVIE